MEIMAYKLKVGHTIQSSQVRVQMRGKVAELNLLIESTRQQPRKI
jgi:hypothetical protein